ncbi:MAG: succinate dehydrogenase cytochrome b subunit [Solirubrobacteraceae bacterium]
MSQGNNLLSSSIGRKITMALSALFLLLFLTQHLFINLLSVINKDTFNEVSHFMGYNPLVQKVIQPILIFGTLYHFILGFILEITNRKARGPQQYAYTNPSANSTWTSRNMIISGILILIFLAIHMVDFFFPEMNYKYIQVNPQDPTRYFPELVKHFQNPIRVALYVVGFIFLGLHLNHGFQSAFQSMGANSKKHTPTIKLIGSFYSILVPILFTFITLFHFFNS